MYLIAANSQLDRSKNKLPPSLNRNMCAKFGAWKWSQVYKPPCIQIYINKIMDGCSYIIRYRVQSWSNIRIETTYSYISILKRWQRAIVLLHSYTVKHKKPCRNQYCIDDRCVVKLSRCYNYEIIATAFSRKCGVTIL